MSPTPPPSARGPDASRILGDVRKAIASYMGRDPGDAEVVFVRTRGNVLGYVELGSRRIRINVGPLTRYIRSEGEEASREYLFVVILHEYLHIMGMVDEREVRRITMEIVDRTFGRRSRASRIAEALADPRDLILRRSGSSLKPYM